MNNLKIEENENSYKISRIGVFDGEVKPITIKLSEGKLSNTKVMCLCELMGIPYNPLWSICNNEYLRIPKTENNTK